MAALLALSMYLCTDRKLELELTERFDGRKLVLAGRGRFADQSARLRHSIVQIDERLELWRSHLPLHDRLLCFHDFDFSLV